jgi:ribose transport system substrate-binding protein
MRRIVIALFLVGLLCAAFYTMYYMNTIYQTTSTSLSDLDVEATTYRVALISPELRNSYWNSVYEGAQTTAQEHDVTIHYWGSYRSNVEHILKNMEIAIASKVDGIIVMGIDDPGFLTLVNKATKKGIPVITISVDAPDTLRKAYVGSDHYHAGIVIGHQLAEAVNGQGKVGLIIGNESAGYLKQRLDGFIKGISRYPEVELVDVSPEDISSNQASLKTQEILNQHPNAKAFVGLSADDGAEIVKAIQKRSKVEDYYIYTFDDTQETLSLLKKGLIDGTLTHSPKQMGERSVSLIVQWLEGRELPLKTNHFTPIQLMTKGDEGKHENNSK